MKSKVIDLQVVQKIARFSPSILTVLIDFSYFGGFPCYISSEEKPATGKQFTQTKTLLPPAKNTQLHSLVDMAR